MLKVRSSSLTMWLEFGLIHDEGRMHRLEQFCSSERQFLGQPDAVPNGVLTSKSQARNGASGVGEDWMLDIKHGAEKLRWSEQVCTCVM